MQELSLNDTYTAPAQPVILPPKAPSIGSKRGRDERRLFSVIPDLRLDNDAQARAGAPSPATTPTPAPAVGSSPKAPRLDSNIIGRVGVKGNDNPNMGR